jgi:hypothetical protein
MSNRGTRSLESQGEATESSPLNNRQSVTIDDSSKPPTMDADTKRILLKIVIDVVLLGSGE